MKLEFLVFLMCPSAFFLMMKDKKKETSALNWISTILKLHLGVRGAANRRIIGFVLFLFWESLNNSVQCHFPFIFICYYFIEFIKIYLNLLLHFLFN